MKSTKYLGFGSRLLILSGLLVCMFLTGACQHASPQLKRGALIGAGAAGGALAGHELGDGKAGAVLAGAAAGGLLSTLALGKDPELLQEGYDRGYLQGQSDAIKRQYFLRQAMESKALPRSKPVQYFLPGPRETPDGRRLQPHLVPLRVQGAGGS